MKTLYKASLALCLVMASFFIPVAGAFFLDPSLPIDEPIPNFDFTEPSVGYYSTVTFFDLTENANLIVYEYGDGVTEYKKQGEVFTHVYTPGQYIVTATVYSVGYAKSISKTVCVPYPTGNLSV